MLVVVQDLDLDIQCLLDAVLNGVDRSVSYALEVLLDSVGGVGASCQRCEAAGIQLL